MSDDLETTVTLRMVYDAVLALVNESQQSRAQWQEAETNLLMQNALHREHLGRIDAKIEDIELDNQDHEREILRLRDWKHKLSNQLTPLFNHVEEIRGAQATIAARIDALESAMRKDTQLLPPPPETEASG